MIGPVKCIKSHCSQGHDIWDPSGSMLASEIKQFGLPSGRRAIAPEAARGLTARHGDENLRKLQPMSQENRSKFLRLIAGKRNTRAIGPFDRRLADKHHARIQGTV